MLKIKCKSTNPSDAVITLVDPDGQEKELNDVIYCVITLQKGKPVTALVKLPVESMEIVCEEE